MQKRLPKIFLILMLALVFTMPAFGCSYETFTEEEHLQTEGQNFIDKLFEGNAMKLVTTLFRNKQLDENDVKELKSFFQMGRD